MKPIAILGAGLTGLSAAYHLRDGYDIFEQADEVGGLCRTMKRGDFLFDYTGHLLHLREDATREILDRLLPDHFARHSRCASIYAQQRYIKYPFQANIHALSPEIIKECILGFVETLQSASDEPPAPAEESFQDWVLRTFGAGIARYFMFPYNQKLWQTPLDHLAADWVSWSIPKPTLDEFLNGALGITNRAFGYNPTFLYPKTGGIDQLPQAFLPCLHQDHVHYHKKAVAIDVPSKTIRFADASVTPYESLISTIPLKHLFGLLQGVPPEIAQAAQQLRYVSVYNINLGVNRPDVSDKHWIYFPEPEYIFYRVGFPMNFSPSVAPPGCSSLYIEVSALPDAPIAEDTLLEQVYAGLSRCGILRKTDEILVYDVTPIECAYVIHDLARSRVLQVLFDYLEAQRIFSVGRYGAWEYNSMEGAILAGRQIAAALHGAEKS